MYIAKNIFQIKKNQLDAKLDRDLQNTAKNHSTKTDLIEGKEVDVDNRVKKVEKKDDNNINLHTAYLYLHTVTIIHMHWRKQEISDCLESSVLSHLYPSLHVTNDASTTNREIC